MTTTVEAAEDAVRRHLAELMAIQQDSVLAGSQLRWNANQGSVLAVVNFPESSGRDCNGMKSFGKMYQLRLDYDRLVAIGSSKVKKMLEPKKQERFRRLLKMKTLPDGVEFVLDFTPPLEGEECSELTASLWLPASTKIWWMAGHYKPSGLLNSGPREHQQGTRPLADKPVGAVLALGHDDECSCYTTYTSISDIWAVTDDVPGIYHGDWTPTYRENIKDYCRVRHCMNIARILRAIAGQDLLVNSATRMWTLAQLAVYLDMVPVVRDSITQWFSAAPNTKFIEMFPEESFRVALMLQMRDVLLASFKILVNERAVDHAATTPLTKPPAVTWMERPRTDYGDLPEDPIEHASRAFADRMKAKLDSLRSDTVFETLNIDEWAKLQYYTKLIADTAAASVTYSPLLTSLLEDLIKLKNALLNDLHDHIKNCIFLGPAARLDGLITAQRAHYCPKDKQTPAVSLVERLNDYQRACLPFFWYHLKDMFAPYHTFRYHTYKREYLTHIAAAFNERLHEAITKGYLTVPLADFREHLLRTTYSFDDKLFHTQLDLELSTLSLQATGFRDSEADGIQLLMSDHLLLTLEEGETKYLPLWAGGFDDGSGGVFQDEVPPADMGPSEPGPHYHTGRTIASSSSKGGGEDTDASSSTVDYAGSSTATFSDLGVGGLDLEDNTTARSTAAQGSAETTMGRRSGVISLPSEGFTSGDEGSMAEAMLAVPAEHQAIAQAVEQYVEGASDGGEETETETETEVGDEFEAEEGDDIDAMDTDDTLSLDDDFDGDEDDDEFADFTII